MPATHFGTRVCEHLLLEPNSHIYKNLQGLELCKNLYYGNSFSILDAAHTTFQLNIDWERPALNKQLKHVNVTFLL